MVFDLFFFFSFKKFDGSFGNMVENRTKGIPERKKERKKAKKRLKRRRRKES